VKVTAFLVLQGDGLLCSHVLSFCQHCSKGRSLVPLTAQVDQTLIGQNSRTPYESSEHLEGCVHDVTVQLHICVAFFRPFQPIHTLRSQ
jgi:hypothetical protein